MSSGALDSHLYIPKPANLISFDTMKLIASIELPNPHPLYTILYLYSEYGSPSVVSINNLECGFIPNFSIVSTPLSSYFP